jgi:hypothetical protein
MSPDAGDGVALVLLLGIVTFSIMVHACWLIALLYWLWVWLSSWTLLNKSLIAAAIGIVLTQIIYQKRHEKKTMEQTNEPTAKISPENDVTSVN